MAEFFSSLLSIILLILGFGFVIFWHELGHFLAAKWVGIRVEQFAVGMGHAIVSFRRGIGVKVGNTRKEYESRAKAHLDKAGGGGEYTEAQINRAADEIGLGQTEYRISWLPIGGYVKMLGQDDMNPASSSDDPTSYQKKTVAQRMLVISAGVIMNIILAGILFMALFMYGFRAPAPVIGYVSPGSPAQRAGIEVGDTVISYDGKPQHDFTKIMLNTALASPTEPLNVRVKKVGSGEIRDLQIQPIRVEKDTKGFLKLGIGQQNALKGLDKKDLEDAEHVDVEPAHTRVLKSGDIVTHVNGIPVQLEEYHVLDQELQKAKGKPVKLTIRRADGGEDKVDVTGQFTERFDGKPFGIGGMQPRPVVSFIKSKQSPAFNQLKPGDIITGVSIRPAGGQPTPVSNPSAPRLLDLMNDAGQKGQTVDVRVIRNGTEQTIPNLKPTFDEPARRKGLGVALTYDDANPVITGTVENTGAAKADLPAGATITAIDGETVANWWEVRDALAKRGEGARKLTMQSASEPKPVERTITMSPTDVADLALPHATVSMALGELSILRKTSSPLIALGWGVTETRDLILQFYVTLKRIFSDRTVSPTNLMGFVGIGHAGFKFANKGTDWLIWFLAMISANLAVVNFLPIPVVDGGHFVFLLIEKLRGRPVPAAIQEFALKFGLVLLLGIFLFVTYNDIARLFGR